MNYLLVFLGGGLGAVARYAVGRGALALFGAGFPVGTLLVNVIGSTALGIIAGWFAVRGLDEPPLRLFLATGVLGGFTTFSAFSLDAAMLWQRGDQWLATGYVAASLLLSIAGLVAGLALTAR